MSVLSNKLYLMIGRRHCCTKTENGTEFYDIGIFRKFKRKPNMKQYYKFQEETKASNIRIIQCSSESCKQNSDTIIEHPQCKYGLIIPKKPKCVVNN